MTALPNLNTILLELRGAALFATLNRPDTRNALSDEVVADLNAVCDVLGSRPDIRALVLRGAGGTFCAGGDISGFARVMRDRDAVAALNRGFGDLLMRFDALPQLTVVLVEGAAFGGGLGLVCVSDVAISLSDTRYALSETSLGILPAQIAPFVVRRIGLTSARRVALTGARFDGKAAVELGLVHFAEPHTAALEARLAAVLADLDRCAPAATAATKAILRASVSGETTTVLDDAAAAFAAALSGAEGQEGVRAFMEKRPANWTGRLTGEGA